MCQPTWQHNWLAYQQAASTSHAYDLDAPDYDAAICDQLNDAHWRRWDDVLATPAPDFGAVMAKLTMIHDRYAGEFPTPDLHHHQLIGDIARLARLVPAQPAPAELRTIGHA